MHFGRFTDLSMGVIRRRTQTVCRKHGMKRFWRVQLPRTGEEKVFLGKAQNWPATSFTPKHRPGQRGDSPQGAQKGWVQAIKQQDTGVTGQQPADLSNIILQLAPEKYTRLTQHCQNRRRHARCTCQPTIAGIQRFRET